MRGKEIRKIFKEAGVKVPAGIDVCAYDQFESWCCGYYAEAVGEEVALQKYCHKGRGKASVTFIKKSGEISLEYPISSDSQPGDFDLEEDEEIIFVTEARRVKKFKE